MGEATNLDYIPSDVPKHVAKVLKDVCGMVSPVEPSDMLHDDYCLEPMDYVELGFALQAQFGVAISDRDITSCVSVQHVIDLTQKALEQ